jgi:16S rRNA G527 N7-methylase RsmG
MTNAQDTTANRAETTNGAPRMSVEAIRARATAVVNSVFDFGAIWADTGIGYVRSNIENGAKALERTAKALETFQERFKRAESKPTA